MKRILLIMALCMGAGALCAQTRAPKEQTTSVQESHPALKGKKVKRVPETVRLNFTHQFPGAESARWYKKNQLYRVQFSLRGQLHIAVYNEQGERMD
ncbi:MAG TPA: hypothetical protein PLE75_07985 [Ferruginibacter sp.]|nr:hypothetical protein [Ferruginibacter sp.]HRO06609.1 hypothetical protein [Ferruginibacter sp.]HRO96869.1 hypothetical protein [Ferruginibacter sp.]HRP50066.1 hypothetical protein [Ferruginibacter sp.]